MADKNHTMEKLPDLSKLSHDEKDVLIIHLWDVVQELRAQLATMSAELAELKGKQAKDSHNSSKPPGADVFRKPKSRRQPSGNKPGGQPGHSGSTLKRAAKADHVIEHAPPAQCDACGATLRDIPAAAEIRQVMELPPIFVQVTEHRRLTVRCSCGKTHRGNFPADVTGPVQYGPRLKALAVYLTQYQLLPVQRSAELMQDIWGVSISAASIDTYAMKAGARIKPVTERIRHAIRRAAVAHFDESGLRVAGALHWLHTAATPQLAWYGHHAKRGSCAIEQFDILPRFAGVAVHDGFATYRDYPCRHGLCNAHHLRELIWLEETGGQAWTTLMIRLLLDAKKCADEAKKNGRAVDRARIDEYRQRFLEIVAGGLRSNPEQPKASGSKRRVKQSPETNLLLRLNRYRDDVMRFLADPDVPFDNNLAERAIRMPKLKQKVSGCFRSEHGADTFCTIRSYLATLRKQGLDLFSALTRTFQGNPLLPAFSP